MLFSVVRASSAAAQVVQLFAPFNSNNLVTFESLAVGAAGVGAFAGYGVTVTGGCFLANSFTAAGFGSAMQGGNVSAGPTACASGTANQAVTLTFDRRLTYFGLLGVDPHDHEGLGQYSRRRLHERHTGLPRALRCERVHQCDDLRQRQRGVRGRQYFVHYQSRAGQHGVACDGSARPRRCRASEAGRLVQSSSCA